MTKIVRMKKMMAFVGDAVPQCSHYKEMQHHGCKLAEGELRIRHKDAFFQGKPNRGHEQAINDCCANWRKTRAKVREEERAEMEHLCPRMCQLTAKLEEMERKKKEE